MEAGLHGALQMLLVPRGAAGDLRVGDGDEDAAADVAGEVDEAGDLVALLLGHADVGRVGDGDEAEGQGQHLNDAQPGRLREAHLQIGDGRSIAEGDDEHDESADGEGARGDFAGGEASHGHDDDQRDAAGGERKARGGGGVSEELLHELRLQHGVGIEHAAHQHHEEATDGEVLETEKLEVDERIFLSPLPHDKADHAADKQEQRRSG